MDRDVILRLASIIGDQTVADALSDYFLERIEQIHTEMEGCNDIIHLRRCQGKVNELRRLTKLREEVLQKAKDIYENG